MTLAERFEKYIFEGKASNDDLVQIFELCRDYLNLRSITDYAKSEKITYNGALKRKLLKTNIGNHIFIINNK